MSLIRKQDLPSIQMRGLEEFRLGNFLEDPRHKSQILDFYFHRELKAEQQRMKKSTKIIARQENSKNSEKARERERVRERLHARQKSITTVIVYMIVIGHFK